MIRLFRIFVLLVLAAGLGVWIVATPFRVDSWWRLLIAGAVTGVALVPPVSRTLTRLFARVRHPSPRVMGITALGVALIAALYLFTTASLQGRDLLPKWHDEQMFLIESHILATGRLWMPALPLPDSFETFHVFTTPVYAGMHFLGTALLYVPSIWLHLPTWLMPLMVAGAVVGLFYRVVAELVDGVAGLLAAMLLLACSQFRFLALTNMSQPVSLFFGLLGIWAWLRWRKHRQLRWAVLIGIVMGWAAIVRPVEAICYAAPVGIAIFLDLWKARNRGEWAKTFAAVAIGAAPFLSLQLVFNHGVTGQWLRSPHQYYTELYHPQLSFGSRHFDPMIRPATTLRQKQDYYDQFVAPAAREYAVLGPLREWTRGRRLLALWNVALPANILIVLFPAGLLALGRRRWVLFGALPLLMVLYSFAAFFTLQYAVALVPPVLFLVILGIRALEDAMPNMRNSMGAAVVVGVAALTILSLPELQKDAGADEVLQAPELVALNEKLATIPGRAIVLFRYAPGITSPHIEPVYNTDVAWPDDARVIRAHDLGPQKNLELFRYYAAHQPDRTVYLCDRKRIYETGSVDAAMTLLGCVRDLANQPSK